MSQKIKWEKYLVIKKEVTAEIMSDVFKVEDFFDNKKLEDDLEINYKKDGEDITFLEKYDKLGTYEVVIKNKDKEYKSLLNVVDTTKPVLKLKNVSIKVNDKYKVSDYMRYLFADRVVVEKADDIAKCIKSAFAGEL